MMTKYRVWNPGSGYIDTDIQEISVYRESEKCVFLLPNTGRCRELKHPKFGRQYFDSKEEAIAFIKGRVRLKISSAIAEKENLPETFKAMEKSAQQKIDGFKRLAQKVELELS